MSVICYVVKVTAPTGEIAYWRIARKTREEAQKDIDDFLSRATGEQPTREVVEAHRENDGSQRWWL